MTEISQERWALPRSSTSTEHLREAFARSGLPPPKVAVETNAGLLRRRLLPMTDLLTFGPRQLFQADASPAQLVEIPVRGLASRQPVSVCYQKDAHLSPAVRRYIEILKATAKEIAKEQS